MFHFFSLKSSKAFAKEQQMFDTSTKSRKTFRYVIHYMSSIQILILISNFFILIWSKIQDVANLGCHLNNRPQAPNPFHVIIFHVNYTHLTFFNCLLGLLGT